MAITMFARHAVQAIPRPHKRSLAQVLLAVSILEVLERSPAFATACGPCLLTLSGALVLSTVDVRSECMELLQVTSSTACTALVWWSGVVPRLAARTVSLTPTACQTAAQISAVGHRTCAGIVLQVFPAAMAILGMTARTFVYGIAATAQALRALCLHSVCSKVIGWIQGSVQGTTWKAGATFCKAWSQRLISGLSWIVQMLVAQAVASGGACRKYGPQRRAASFEQRAASVVQRCGNIESAVSKRRWRGLPSKSEGSQLGQASQANSRPLPEGKSRKIVRGPTRSEESQTTVTQQLAQEKPTIAVSTARDLPRRGKRALEKECSEGLPELSEVVVQQGSCMNQEKDETLKAPPAKRRRLNKEAAERAAARVFRWHLGWLRSSLLSF